MCEECRWYKESCDHEESFLRLGDFSHNDCSLYQALPLSLDSPVFFSPVVLLLCLATLRVDFFNVQRMCR